MRKYTKQLLLLAALVAIPAAVIAAPYTFKHQDVVVKHDLTVEGNIVCGSITPPEGFALNDSGQDNTVTIQTLSDEAANRTATVPALGGNKTFDMIDVAQTISAVKTFSAIPIFPAGTVTRANLVQQDLQSYAVPLQNCRTNTGLNLDATGGAALFKIVNGGIGTGGLTLKGNDADNGSITSTLCFEFQLPPEYVDGETVTLAVRGDLTGGGAFTTKTLDAEVYELDADGAVGADICATDAQTLAEATPTTYSFTVTPTGLVAGDRLLVYLQSVVAESGTAASRAVLSKIEVKADIKG